MDLPWIARVLGERRRAWLARPRSHLILALASALVCSTSLGVGWQLDDHVHHVIVRGGDGARLMWREPLHPLDLFRFVDGDEADWRHGVELGAAPWYTSPRVRLAFFRPLASATHFVDYRWLERAPWAMHLHSLLWLFALGWAVARLVRRIEEGWVAGLIVLFYVLDPSHGVPAGWLANRNQLIAGVFGALALEAHVRWRREELRTPIAPITLAALGLAAGESMLGWAAFFGAFALCLDPRGPRRGLVALAPIAALVIAWRVVYGALGYGAGGSALYVDPVRDPLRFSAAVLERMPQLLAGQIGGPPAGMASLGGREAELAAIGAGVLVVATFAAVAWPALREDARARFWALGALLAAIPVCATQPHTRLMLVAGLGVAGVLARSLARVVEGAPAHRAARGLLFAWLALFVVVAPGRLAFEAWSVALVGRPAALAAASVPEEAAGRTLVVLAVPDPMFMCGQLPLTLASLDRPRPARLRCVAAAERRALVAREDERTLVVRVPDGLLSAYFIPLLRDPSDPIEEGWTLSLSDVTYSIAERDAEGRPLALRMRFATPLEDASRVFVAWSPRERRFAIFEPPAVGQEREIEGQSMAQLMGGG